MENFKGLEQVTLLQNVPPQVLDQLRLLAEEYHYADAEIISAQGGVATHLYLLLNGRVEVVQTDIEGFEHRIATLQQGEIFGERALLMADRRSADVIANGPVRIARLPWPVLRELMQQYPQLYDNLCRRLAHQLGNWSIRHQKDEKEARELLTNLVGWQVLPEFDSFPGVSPWARQLNQQISQLALEQQHVLVQGERGTWKELVARLIHYHCGDQSRPILYLNCADPPPVLKQQDDRRNHRRDPLLTALAQESALFGHAPDSLVYTEGTRRGYLELGDGGELILENVEFLDLKVQHTLADFLCSGVLFRRGEDDAHYTDVRLIATSDENLAELVAQGLFNAELYELLKVHNIKLQPLRDRKKDIPVIAKRLLIQLNRKHHKQVRGLSQEALNRLVDYHWPLNGQELQQVIDRAVAVCNGELILPEQIFLNITAEADSQRVNLLQLPLVRRLFEQGKYPQRLFWLTVPGFVMIIFGCLFGSVQQNPANLLVWGIWWPFLLLWVWFTGRSWCSFCPLEGLARLWPWEGTWREPQWLQKYGSLLALTGCILLLWLEQQGQLFLRATGTAHLLLALLGMALICQHLFGKRRWCKYLCPLGWLIGRSSRYSMLKLRSNNNVCLSQCQIDDCIREKECPMGLHPTAAEKSDDCVLCGSCVRHCPHDAIRLDLRFPWQGVLAAPSTSILDALLPPLLLAVVLAVRGAEKIAPQASWGGSFLLLTMLMLASFALATIPRPQQFWRQRLVLFGVASLPLALSGLFGLFFRELLEQGPQLPMMLFGDNRLTRMLPDGQLNLGTLHILMPLLILTGLIFSWFLLQHLLVKQSALQVNWLPARTLLVSLGVSLLWLL